MSKKFTEEQYKKIIKEWENATSYTKGTKAVIDYLEYEDLGSIADEALAIANPLTREWAHEQFVEKENKYYWKLNGLYLRKDYSDSSIIFDSHMYKHSLTETDIKEWGYNPEIFDKEEVD